MDWILLVALMRCGWSAMTVSCSALCLTLSCELALVRMRGVIAVVIRVGWVRGNGTKWMLRLDRYGRLTVWHLDFRLG